MTLLALLLIPAPAAPFRSFPLVGPPLTPRRSFLRSAAEVQKKSAAEAADIATASEASRERAAQQAAEAATGGDGFTIDIRTGEKVYIESGTKRKYRLGPPPDFTKLYEDEKAKKAYGGAGSFVQGGATTYTSGGREGVTTPRS